MQDMRFEIEVFVEIFRIKFVINVRYIIYCENEDKNLMLAEYGLQFLVIYYYFLFPHIYI